MFFTKASKQRVSNDLLDTSLQLTLESVPTDTAAPEFINSSPSYGSIEIVNTNIELFFSEPIVAGQGNIVISNGSDTRTIVIDDASQVTFSDDKVIINPSEDLLPFTTYTVQLEDGVVEDLSGNTFVNSDDFSSTFFSLLGINFKTVPDFFSPQMDYSDFDEVFTLKIDNQIELHFNEQIKAGSGNLIISNGIDTLTIAATDASQVIFENDTLIIDLTDDLTPDTDYILHISADAVTDLAGNLFIFLGGQLDTNVGLGIKTIASNPLLISNNLFDDSQGFQVDSAIQLTFDEQVKAGSGDIIISNGSDIHTIAVDDEMQVSFDEDGTVTINPSTDLIPNSSYNVQIASGVILDMAGNAYAGISDTEALNFSAIKSNPQLISTQPSSDDMVMLVDDNITLFFNEAIVVGEGNIIISNGEDTRSIAINDTEQVTFNDMSVTLNLATDLISNTNYSVQIEDGAIVDTVGNAYLETDNVASLDILALSTDPVLLSSTPSNGADDFYGGQNIDFRFNEEVMAGTGNIIISNGTDTHVIAADDTSQINYSGSKVSINPTTKLIGDTTYSVQVDKGVFVDTTGHPYLGINEGTFTTRAVPEFELRNMSDALQLKVDDVLWLNFTREVIAGSGDIIISNGSDVRTIAINDASQVSFERHSVIVDLSVSLQANTTYQIAIADGVIKDNNGDTFSGIDNLALTTIIGNPVLVGSNPQNNTRLKIGNDIQLHFDEAVSAGSGNIVFSHGEDIRIITIDDTSQVVFSQRGGVTISLTEALAADTTYNVQIANGVIVDAEGNAYAGVSNASITTVASDPLLSSTHPKDSETFKVDDKIQLFFDETVTPGKGNIIISDGTDTRTIPAGNTNQVIFDTYSNSVTISLLEDLVVGETYHIQIDNDAVTDLDGNSYLGFNDETTLNFTTVSSDPKLIFSNPREQSVHKIGSPITLYFDEEVMVGNGDIIISNGSDTRIISINDGNQVQLFLNSVNIFLSEDLVADTTYTAQMADGAILDMKGNTYEGFSDAVFTTTATDPVLTTFSDPINGASFDTNRNIELRFDEVVAAGSGDIIISNGIDTRSIAIDDTSQVEFSTFFTTTSSSGNGQESTETGQVIINPTDDLVIDTTYSIQMARGVIVDTEGHSFAGLNDAINISFDTNDPSISSSVNFGRGMSFFSDSYIIEPIEFHSPIIQF